MNIHWSRVLPGTYTTAAMNLFSTWEVSVWADSQLSSRHFVSSNECLTAEEALAEVRQKYAGDWRITAGRYYRNVDGKWE